MTKLDRSRKAPFPWFGGKSTVADEVWRRLGSPKQYIEPFCGSAAMLLAAPAPASLEVIGDANCYVANFWRALKCQPDAVTVWQDYPVSHIDLYARHRWLTEPARVSELRAKLIDAEWPGDAQIAGWWLWGQCCWIGGGWRDRPVGDSKSNGRIPLIGQPGQGVQGSGAEDSAREWMLALSSRLARVRIVHGDWTRCLNHRHGADETAIFLDPPYRNFEKIYSDNGPATTPVADDVAAWAREHAHLHVALCGHQGDYAMPGGFTMEWSRHASTLGSVKTREAECIWFSPACDSRATQGSLFGGAA